MSEDGVPGIVDRHTRSYSVGLPVLLLPFGLDKIIKWFNKQIFGAVFDLIEVLFSGVLASMLKLDPAKLSKFQTMYDLSMAVFFSLLTIFALSYLGMFQLFPENSKTDPYRFMSRALAATLAVLIVNPPGKGTLFSQGAFAWAFAVSNAAVDLFMHGVTFDMTAPSSPGGTLANSFLMLILAQGLVVVVVLVQIVLFVILIARQVVVYLTYGLFPLLIVFWVADAGPLKYGKQLSEKLFKATGMLIPGGILVAGIFAVGTTFTVNTTKQFAGGTTTGGADATFASLDPIIGLALPPMAVAATCFLPIVYLGSMFSGTMGGIASKATGVAKKGLKKGAGGLASKAGIGGGQQRSAGGLLGGGQPAGDASGGRGQPAGAVPDEPAATGSSGSDTMGDAADELTDPGVTANAADSDTQGPTPSDDRRQYADPAAGTDTDGAADTGDSDTGSGDSYSPGDLTFAEAKQMTGGDEDAAKTLQAMDQKMAELAHQPDEGTKAGQEIVGGAIAGTAGAAAGSSVGKALGAIGGSVAGPAGTVAGAAIGGAIGGVAGGGLGYVGKQVVGEGSIRGGLSNAMDAANDFKQAAVDMTPYIGDSDADGAKDAVNNDDYEFE